MPLQNRVEPFGDIHPVAARGLFTGNRGVIHDPGTKTLMKRRWTTKAWIICTLTHPRGRTRDPMGRNSPSGGAGWTELFFLDEVTALAAGHRPCFFCRRERAVEFARYFAAGQGRATVSAPEMDAILHRERWASDDIRQNRSKAPLAPPHKGEGELPHAKSPSPLWGGARGGGIAISDRHSFPSGTVIAVGGEAFAWTGEDWLEWAFDGWRPASPPAEDVFLLTPPATVAALRAGYAPTWHQSAT